MIKKERFSLFKWLWRLETIYLRNFYCVVHYKRAANLRRTPRSRGAEVHARDALRAYLDTTYRC
jgi:hypothetical protein